MTVMNLVQILLPIKDNDGRPFPREHFEALRRELTDRFGGLTTYSRAPAEGLFSDAAGQLVRDDVIVFEVMAPAVDRAFWTGCRTRLMALFQQEDVLIRSWPVERL